MTPSSTNSGKLNGQPNASESLCLACGLCCNGVLFKDVELQKGDDAQSFEALGLTLTRFKRKTCFPQPCSALCEGNRCRIYDDRPLRCRQFECALLKNCLAGKLEIAAALRIIGAATQRANRVRSLLRQLGDHDDHLALSVRFRRTKLRAENSILEQKGSATFAKLTQAIHALNVILQKAFYPGKDMRL